MINIQVSPLDSVRPLREPQLTPVVSPSNMDPLSISTGVFAIATLATQTCSAFSDLCSLCLSLPGRLHAVNNEVADLNYVLSKFRYS